MQEIIQFSIANSSLEIWDILGYSNDVLEKHLFPIPKVKWQ